MQNLKQEDWKDLYAMRHLTVKAFIEKVKAHPTLCVLLTTAGVWLVVRIAFFILVAGNVLYLVGRIFNMVLG